jgi:hypothetical protein
MTKLIVNFINFIRLLLPATAYSITDSLFGAVVIAILVIIEMETRHD